LLSGFKADATRLPRPGRAGGAWFPPWLRARRGRRRAADDDDASREFVHFVLLTRPRSAQAGANVIFVEAPRTVEEITVIAREITAPKLINVVAGGLTPEVDQAMLGELGYSIAIYPTTALLAAANAAVTALRGIGGSAAVPPPTARMEDFFRLVGLDEWFAVSERWSIGSR